MTHEHATGRARVGIGLNIPTIGFVLGVAAALALAISLIAGDPSSQQGAAHPRGGSAHLGDAPAAVSVWIHARHPGAPVPPRFLGLSFELSSAGQIAAYANSGNFANLLRSLGTGVLRFGGVSADTRVAWVDAGTPRPAWASGVLTVADLHALGKLAARSHWPVLLTIGLVHYDPRVAAREAAAAKAALGPWLAGIEVGNEPDAYGQHNLRPAPWTALRYEAEVTSYRRAIAKVAPGIPLAGPGVSGSFAYKRWGPAEVLAQKPALLTGHHYPLGCHAIPAPTIAALLSPRTRQMEGVSLERYLSVARASSIPFRVDETNSVSCGGKAGISDTFASALWAVSYISQTMVAGASGINLQGNPANCSGYSPVCASSPERLASGLLQAQPVWYALLLSRELVGDRPVGTTVTSPQRPNVAVNSLVAGSGRLQVVIVEDDPPGSGGATVRVHVGSALRTATVLALTAPSPGARSVVELGGRAVAADGSWPGPERRKQIAVTGGVLTLSVPPSSAALVTVSR